jgi:hypothetical protein
MTDTQDKYKLVDCKEVVHIDATDNTTQSDAFKKGKVVVPIKALRDTSQEIVIHSQKELDKLLDDNYNALDEVVLIDKDLRLDSSKKTYWNKGKAFFKHAIRCRNIDAGLMNIESNSQITAHNITAYTIKCTNIHAHNIDCKYLKARTVSAHATTSGRIYSNSVYIRNMPTLFYSYDFWDTKNV